MFSCSGKLQCKLKTRFGMISSPLARVFGFKCDISGWKYFPENLLNNDLHLYLPCLIFGLKHCFIKSLNFLKGFVNNKTTYKDYAV